MFSSNPGRLDEQFCYLILKAVVPLFPRLRDFSPCLAQCITKRSSKDAVSYIGMCALLRDNVLLHPSPRVPRHPSAGELLICVMWD